MLMNLSLINLHETYIDKFNLYYERFIVFNNTMRAFIVL